MKDFILLIGKNKIRSCSVAFLASLVVLCNLPLPLLIKAIIDSLLDERDALQLHTITLLFILLTTVQVLCNAILVSGEKFAHLVDKELWDDFWLEVMKKTDRQYRVGSFISDNLG